MKGNLFFLLSINSRTPNEQSYRNASLTACALTLIRSLESLVPSVILLVETQKMLSFELYCISHCTHPLKQAKKIWIDFILSA
jgi:hypothetical protein